MTKNIYPEVAKKFKTKSSCVERSIRHAIDMAWSKGRVYKLKAYEIPEAGRTARGTAIVNLLELQPEEKISAIVPINGINEDEYKILAYFSNSSLSVLYKFISLSLIG